MALSTVDAPPQPGRFGRMLAAYRGSSVHQGGVNEVKGLFGFGVDKKGAPIRGLGRWMGRGILAYSVYEGYKEGGVVGAVKGTGSAIAQQYAFGAASRLVGMAGRAGPYGWAALGVAAAAGIGLTMTAGGRGLLTQGVRPWVNAHMKKRADLELATPVVDDFGTVATMRQRSLQAIQNSRLNGRTALGNEAALLYTPYFR